MNGVRRFLGAATAAAPTSPPPPPQDTTPPLAFAPKQGPSWPPQSPIGTPASSPKSTPALLVRQKQLQQQQQRSSLDDGPGSAPSTPIMSPVQRTGARTSSPGSTASSSSPRMVSRNVSNASSDRKRVSVQLNTRDELLISLLASQAVVDSRDFDILTSEDVDELKKEHQLLSSRLEAAAKKLTLESKIRDAATSLSKVNAAHKKVSKQTDEQLAAATRRVDAAQRELWRLQERAHEVHRRLLEHRAGVLALSVRGMEKKMGGGGAGGGVGAGAEDDSGYDSRSNRSTLMSPTTSSMTGVSSSGRHAKARFDGAHLFAGHADAVIPRRKLSPEDAAAEIGGLEEKLRAATEALGEAGKKHLAMTRELGMMRLEKEEVETMMGMELQSAEERVQALEGLEEEVEGLRRERDRWEEERVRMEERAREAEVEVNNGGATDKLLREEREGLQRVLAEKEAEIERLREGWEADRAAWEAERKELEDEKMEDMARLEEVEMLKEEEVRKANEEVDAGLSVLRGLVQQHGIVLFSRDTSLGGLLRSVDTHLGTVHAKLEAHSKAEAEWEVTKRRLEEDVRSGLDKRETLIRELEDARKEARDSIKEPVQRSPVSYEGDSAARIISILEPLWNILPSPEARAAKFNKSRSFRTGSPTPNSPAGKSVSSLSDLDVRSLKSLYETTRGGGGAAPSSPRGGFTVEGFAERVQALMADDRALIERLVRFAQAHDLLKKNAERAQKLAQEGNTALETYQKQVRTLEERNMSIAAKQAAMHEEVQHLQEVIERVSSEKTEVEMLAAEQAETCRQLTEANNTLSARTLTLAEEAASAPEMVRKQLEGQLAECRAALELARDEVDGMRMSEQSQRIALLDELNSMQTENGVLRAQLRARK